MGETVEEGGRGEIGRRRKGGEEGKERERKKERRRRREGERERERLTGARVVPED